MAKSGPTSRLERWETLSAEKLHVPDNFARQFGQTLRRKVNVRIPRRRRADNRKKISVHKARDIAHAVGEWNYFPANASKLAHWDTNRRHKLIDRSSVAAIREVVVLITVPSQKRTWVGSQRHLDSFTRKPERELVNQPSWCCCSRQQTRGRHLNKQQPLGFWSLFPNQRLEQLRKKIRCWAEAKRKHCKLKKNLVRAHEKVHEKERYLRWSGKMSTWWQPDLNSKENT